MGSAAASHILVVEQTLCWREPHGPSNASQSALPRGDADPFRPSGGAVPPSSRGLLKRRSEAGAEPSFVVPEQVFGPQIPVAIMAGTGSFLRVQADGTVAPVPGCTPANDPACIFVLQKGGVALHMRVAVRSFDGRLLCAPTRVGAPVTLGSISPPDATPAEERERWQLATVDRLSEGAVYLKTHRASAECGPYLTCAGDGQPVVTAETVGDVTLQLWWLVDPAVWPRGGPQASSASAPRTLALGGAADSSLSLISQNEAMSSFAELDALSLASPVVADDIRCVLLTPAVSADVSSVLVCRPDVFGQLIRHFELVSESLGASLTSQAPTGCGAHPEAREDPWLRNAHEDSPRRAPSSPPMPNRGAARTVPRVEICTSCTDVRRFTNLPQRRRLRPC